MSYKDRRRLLWILFLIGLGLIAVVAQATTLVRLHFQDLVHYSYSIARVRCMHADVRVENGEIWTDTSVRVLSHNKGYLPEEIVVRQPGGKFQHLHSHVDGVPEFRPGEEVYLFLSAHSGGQFLIVGWAQGTFRTHPRKSARFSTPTFISIPATRSSAFPLPPRSPPIRNPTTSNPSSRTNSATLSASATPPCGAQ
jgi:hypothetical protein